jgi:hypothetical protein
MSDEVKNFIDKIADGDNAAAGDAFKDALRMKVGDALDAHRQEVAGNMFNGTFEAQPHSDPKPVIADPGTFNQDGSVAPTTNVGLDGEAQIDLSQGTEDAGQ